MYMQKLEHSIETVKRFLRDHLHQEITDVTALSGGEWSQAVAFKSAGKDCVIRFGKHRDDYIKDQSAAKFASDKLLIPKVLEVGKAFDGYYAISERAYGTMIDALDKAAMRRAIPSVFATMDVIREVDISDTTGFGQLDVIGNGKYSSWRKLLLSVADDKPGMKTHGWKAGLQDSPIGIKPFEKAYESLVILSKDLPGVRSLIHNDLLNFNVMVNDNRISAVIDWANAMYGDFLYDLSQFTFWEPIYAPIKGIAWEAKILEHYRSIGLEVPEFKQRLQCCMIHMGLAAQSYYGYKKDWTYLEPVANRIL